MNEPLQTCREGCLFLDHHKFCAWHGTALGSLAGQEAGKFKLERAVDGSGSFRAVYEARHIVQETLRVDVEILKPPFCYSREMVENYLSSAAALQRVRTPQVPEVIDCSLQPWPHVVMRLPEGIYLSQKIEEARTIGPLPIGECVAIFEGMARALAAIHRVGLIHRNLKPSNVFLAEEPGADARELVRVLDWVIAVQFDPAQGEIPPTPPGQLTRIGTPQFMAPEQFRGAFTARTDVYQFGLIAFELLTGESAYHQRGPSTTSSITAWQDVHTTQNPKNLRKLRNDVPGRLARTIRRCLRKDPRKRFATGKQLLEALEALRLPFHQRLLFDVKTLFSR